MAQRRISKTRRPFRKVRPRPKALPQPPSPTDEDPFDDPVVEQITGDILQHLGAANSQEVAVRAEIGQLLLDVRAQLPHGAYRPYLSRHVPFTPSTAQRAVNLHRFREKYPVLFDKLRPVGLSKVNVVITRPIAEVEALASQAHEVPSTGATKTLLSMTFKELMQLITNTQSNDDKDTRVANYRRAGRRLVRALDTLVDAPDNVDRHDLADLYEELRLTLSRFAATFELGSK